MFSRWCGLRNRLLALEPVPVAEPLPVWILFTVEAFHIIQFMGHRNILSYEIYYFWDVKRPIGIVLSSLY